MAQSVMCPTLVFGSGHDLTVRELEPRIGLRVDSVEPAWDSLPPHPAPPPHLSSARSLCLCQNK